MDISSQFEEVQQEENLDNDEKPPDSGGILFNREYFLRLNFLGDEKQPLLFSVICIHLRTYWIPNRKHFCFLSLVIS